MSHREIASSPEELAGGMGAGILLSGAQQQSQFPTLCKTVSTKTSEEAQVLGYVEVMLLPGKVKQGPFPS